MDLVVVVDNKIEEGYRMDIVDREYYL